MSGAFKYKNLNFPNFWTAWTFLCGSIHTHVHVDYNKLINWLKMTFYPFLIWSWTYWVNRFSFSSFAQIWSTLILLFGLKKACLLREFSQTNFFVTKMSQKWKSFSSMEFYLTWPPTSPTHSITMASTSTEGTEVMGHNFVIVARENMDKCLSDTEQYCDACKKKMLGPLQGDSQFGQCLRKSIGRVFHRTSVRPDDQRFQSLVRDVNNMKKCA